jgi:hypothetical protein
MSLELPHVFTVNEVAESVRSTPDSVIAEFEGGRLRGFQVGGEWRTTLPDVLAFIGASNGVTSTERRTESPAANVLVQRGFEIEWRPAEGFDYRWPSRTGEPEAIEEYPVSFEGIVSKNGRIRQNKRLLIGFTTRESAGMADRRRATVFLMRTDSRNGTPTLYPLVEFAGANDYDTTHRLASVIKLRNRKQLKPGDLIPVEYRNFETCVYSDVVNGPYASNGLAMVVRDNDLDSMAHHALVRLKWSGMKRDDDFLPEFNE